MKNKLLVGLSLLMFMGCSKIDNADSEMPVRKKKWTPIFKFTVELHRASRDCFYGLGFCDAHMWILGDQVFSIDDGEGGFNTTLDEANQAMTLAWLENPTGNYTGDDLNLEVGPDYFLPEEIAQDLNVSTVQLIEATYTYDETIGSHGGYLVEYTTTE